MARKSMMGRLRDWRAVVSTVPVMEDPEVLGGREAEHFLNTLLQAHLNFRGASLYPNKRVPAGHRRREIDLIVVSAKRIHIIEVKNWSGTLKVVGNAWIQTNRNGRDIEHPNLLSDHQDKSTVLLNYLDAEGIQLDRTARSKYLSNKVIFMNPRLSVLSQAIAEHPDILLHHRLNAYLEQQKRAGLGESLLGSLVQWCLDTESAEEVMDGYFGSLPRDKIEAIRTAIDKLSTWDSVKYLGTRVEIGDIIHLSIGGEIIRRDRLPNCCSLRLKWTRNRAWGLFKALTGLGEPGWVNLPGMGRRPLSSGDGVFFHRVGEKEPVQVPLTSVEELTFG